MKVGIYNEPGGIGVGGSETLVALLAELLAREHGVEIVHHIPGLTRERLAGGAGADLAGVSLRFVERDGDRTHYLHNPLARYRAARRWHAELSAPYDLFVATLHGVPPFCHARRGALIILFPAETAPHLSPAPPELLRKSALRRRVEGFYQRFEWRRRLGGYQLVTAISEFSKLWTLRRWGAESEVVFPPVDVRSPPARKEEMILSVGRFAVPGEGHTKAQPEMLAVFRELEECLPAGWEYQTVGGLRDTPAHRAFFAELTAQAALCRRAVVRADLGREELRSLYGRASIFWHAAGYGSDGADPVMAEHFGISTVEAMAAGCVPVVINKGGQPEIVQHGVSGFLWDTPEELKRYTAELARDAGLRERMSRAARERAQHFGREAFAERFLRLLRPLLGGGAAASG